LEENVFSVEYILENGLDKSAYGFVYLTEYEINKERYLGQRVFHKRGWKTYLGSGKHYKRAERLYGKENFNREIVAIAYSKEELNELEIEFIKLHNAVERKDYYNILMGGGTLSGYHHSDATKQKMRNSAKGRVISEEQKKILSEFNKGKILSEEHKRKMSESRKGHIASEKTRQKISESHKKRVISEEQKSKMLEIHKGNKYWLGKHHSGDSKQKMSKVQRKFTDQQIIEIRKQYDSGDYYQYELAEKFSCDRTVINKIVNYKGAYKANPLLLPTAI